MGDEHKLGQTNSMQLKDILERSPYKEHLEQILRFYVPLALQLLTLRDDPEFMQATIKAAAASGITDVATKADVHMQQLIKEQVTMAHPDWQFWGEEGEDNVKEYDETKSFLLLTDPIEGTNNFRAKKDDQWGSVIALVDLKTKEPVIGIVAHPTKRLFYVGVKGSGVYTLQYDEEGNLVNVQPMGKAPEKDIFTYNASPHFEQRLVDQVDRFFGLGNVQPDAPNASELDKSRKIVHVPSDAGEESIFEDPESGALEVIRYKGTIYFKTSNEMAAVFAILNELGGKVTDAKGEPWHLGINTLIAARTEQDHAYLQEIYNKTTN